MASLEVTYLEERRFSCGGHTGVARLCDDHNGKPPYWYGHIDIPKDVGPDGYDRSDLVTFSGASCEEAYQDFLKAIDDYCNFRNKMDG